MLAFLAVGLIVVAAFLFLLGVACMTRRARPVPGIFPERARPWPAPPASKVRNVRRPLSASCDCDAEARNAEIRALIDFPMREPCWADDEVTKVGGAA